MRSMEEHGAKAPSDRMPSGSLALVPEPDRNTAAFTYCATGSRCASANLHICTFICTSVVKIRMSTYGVSTLSDQMPPVSLAFQ